MIVRKALLKKNLNLQVNKIYYFDMFSFLERHIKIAN